MPNNKQPKHRTIEDYPIMLRAEDISEILRISRSETYLLMRQRRFPTLFVGKRMVVPRDRLIAWIEEQLGEDISCQGGQSK